MPSGPEGVCVQGHRTFPPVLCAHGADETVKANTEGVTNSGHVRNLVHNQAAKAKQCQPLILMALLSDKDIYWLSELSSPCGT
jgi:hypothetical protein